MKNRFLRSIFHHIMTVKQHHSGSMIQYVQPRTPRSSDCSSGSDSYDGGYSSDYQESTSSPADTCDDDNDGVEPQQLDLSLPRLQSLHASGDQCSENMSEYATNGMSMTRIKTALKAPACECRCSMPAKLLEKVCKAFWCLRKEVQDSLLWTLQLESGRGSKRKWSIAGLGLIQTFYSKIIDIFVVLKFLFCNDLMLERSSCLSLPHPWTLSGHQVCRQAWFHLMGIGKMRMLRCKRRFYGKDQRSIGGVGGPLT